MREFGKPEMEIFYLRQRFAKSKETEKDNGRVDHEQIRVVIAEKSSCSKVNGT